jgi:site-specific DNA-methyltransferase (adenine-specific)
MTERVERLAEGVTLYLGDCREILPTLGKVDMIFTDPPYGHNNNNGDLIHNREKVLGYFSICEELMEARPIVNDGKEEATALINWFFSQLPSLLMPGSCCCCCGGGGGPDPQFARWALEMDRHIKFKQMVVWDKGPMGMGWHYRRSYETILVGEMLGAACRWFDESSQIENIIRPGYLGIKKILPRVDDHPTPKPPELARFFIQLHTIPTQTVLDPFMGSGTTGVAAFNLRRRFFGIEIDPKYFDMACHKIQAAIDEPNLFVEKLPKMKRKSWDEMWK